MTRKHGIDKSYRLQQQITKIGAARIARNQCGCLDSCICLAQETVTATQSRLNISISVFCVLSDEGNTVKLDQFDSGGRVWVELYMYVPVPHPHHCPYSTCIQCAQNASKIADLDSGTF